MSAADADELFLADRAVTYNAHVNAGKIEKAEECIAHIQETLGTPSDMPFCTRIVQNAERGCDLNFLPQCSAGS